MHLGSIDVSVFLISFLHPLMRVISSPSPIPLVGLQSRFSETWSLPPVWLSVLHSGSNHCLCSAGIDLQLTHRHLATSVFFSGFLVRWGEAGRVDLGFVTCTSIFLLPVELSTSPPSSVSSPRVQFFESVARTSSAHWNNLQKFWKYNQPSPHTNRNSHQKLWDRTYVSFGKLFMLFQCAAEEGNHCFRGRFCHLAPCSISGSISDPICPCTFIMSAAYGVCSHPKVLYLPPSIRNVVCLNTCMAHFFLSDFCSVARTTSHGLSSCSISHIRSVRVLLGYFFSLERKL